MAEYKVGDKVRILNTTELREEYKHVKNAEVVVVMSGEYLRIRMADGNTQLISIRNVEPDVPTELTFIQLIEKLPELEVGTEFKGSTGDLYVGSQKNPVSTTNKFLYWKSTDEPVAVTSVTLKAKFTELIPFEPPKPEYTAIKWQEALQIIADGGTVYADDEKVEVGPSTSFEEVYCTDIEDLIDGTYWYKKTE